VIDLDGLDGGGVIEFDHRLILDGADAFDTHLARRPDVDAKREFVPLDFDVGEDGLVTRGRRRKGALDDDRGALECGLDLAVLARATLGLDRLDGGVDDGVRSVFVVVI